MSRAVWNLSMFRNLDENNHHYNQRDQKRYATIQQHGESIGSGSRDILNGAICPVEEEGYGHRNSHEWQSEVDDDWPLWRAAVDLFDVHAKNTLSLSC
jgi:hypothetical protein